MDINFCFNCGSSVDEADAYCSEECRQVDDWQPDAEHSSQTFLRFRGDLEATDSSRGSDSDDSNSYYLSGSVRAGASYQTSKVCDIYALACTVYEIYTGKPPTQSTHPIVPILRTVVNRNRLVPPLPKQWTPEEKTMWWLVDMCWKNHASGPRTEADLIERILKDIGHLDGPPEDISAFENFISLDSVDDPGIVQLSNCLRWVLNVDDIRSRHLGMFNSEMMSLDDQNGLEEVNEPMPDSSRLTHKRNDSSIPTASSGAPSQNLPPESSRAQRRPSISEGSVVTSLSDDSQAGRHSPTSYETTSSESPDPTLHPNWRSRISRRGYRPLDIQYGSLSYLVSARRRLMSRSSDASSGSSRVAWRNDHVSVSDS